ncbi:MAG: MSMEG_1061 family FMN-dependent PPOX-type flavoprotein [Pseudomonadota bacterium]
MAHPLAGRFSDPITSREELRAFTPDPSPIARDKVIDHLDAFCREFIGLSPFVVIASMGEGGWLDLSPKGDPAGFVRILDDKTLAIPDRLGNRRNDTFVNVFNNPSVGLIFLMPGKRETLRVCGQALLVRDQDLREDLAHKGKVPHSALVVHVDRIMFHCSKCMVRSGLWEPEKWADVSGVSSLAEAMKVHSQMSEPLDEIQAIIDASEKERLY